MLPSNFVEIETIKQTLEKDPSVIQYVKGSIQIKHPEIVESAIRKDGRLIEYVQRTFREKPDLIDTALDTNPLALKYAIGDAITGNFNIVMKAVRKDGENLKYASDALKDNNQIVFEAVKHSDSALQHASLRLRNDDEIVLAAVKRQGHQLMDASGRLQGDRNTVIEAVKNNHSALEFASKELRDDEGIIMTAIEYYTRKSRYITLSLKLLNYASLELRDNKMIVSKAVGLNALELEYASDRLKQEKEIVLAAVKNDGRSLRFVSAPKIIDDQEIAMTAVKNCGWALQYLSKKDKQNPELVLTAFNQVNKIRKVGLKELELMACLSKPQQRKFHKYIEYSVKEIFNVSPDQFKSFLMGTKQKESKNDLCKCHLLNTSGRLPQGLAKFTRMLIADFAGVRTSGTREMSKEWKRIADAANNLNIDLGGTNSAKKALVSESSPNAIGNNTTDGSEHKENQTSLLSSSSLTSYPSSSSSSSSSSLTSYPSSWSLSSSSSLTSYPSSSSSSSPSLTLYQSLSSSSSSTCSPDNHLSRGLSNDKMEEDGYISTMRLAEYGDKERCRNSDHYEFSDDEEMDEDEIFIQMNQKGKGKKRKSTVETSIVQGYQTQSETSSYLSEQTMFSEDVGDTQKKLKKTDMSQKVKF